MRGPASVGSPEPGASVKRRNITISLVATAACIGGASFALAHDSAPTRASSSASAEPHCATLPEGCVTAIKRVDLDTPGATTVTRNANGSVTVTWSPNGPGTIEPLPYPMSASEALQRFGDTSPSHALQRLIDASR